MGLCEDWECGVCFLPYSRLDRIPRVLHCRHTFCSPCLEAMSQPKGDLLTVRCPFCRHMTCVGKGLGLHEALWVDTQLWDQMSGEPEEEESEESEDSEDERASDDSGAQDSTQAECPTSKPSKPKLKLPGFLKKLSRSKQNQERIVPDSNVEMKSWRRLSTEDSV